MLFFIFPNDCVKNLEWKNHNFWERISRVLMNFYCVTNIFDNETTSLLKIGLNLNGNAFCFLIFSFNERNIATSLLMIHLKCTVVHYANLNSSSINKPYLLAVEYTFLLFFFDFLFIFILIRFLLQTLWKNYHFFIQVSKIHLKM